MTQKLCQPWEKGLNPTKKSLVWVKKNPNSNGWKNRFGQKIKSAISSSIFTFPFSPTCLHDFYFELHEQRKGLWLRIKDKLSKCKKNKTGVQNDDKKYLLQAEIQKHLLKT